MNVSSASIALRQALAAYQPESAQGADRQIAILKKALDAQKSEGAELMKLLEDKGRVVDIRV